MSTGASCVLIGAGGHARVVVDLFEAAQLGKPAAALDADEKRWGTTLDGVPIQGGDDRLAELARSGFRWFVVATGSVGDCRARRRLFELGCAAGLQPLTIVHPSATLSRSAVLGPGAQLLARSVVNIGSRIGANVIVNTGAIVEHNCEIGDHAHIASGAVVGGNVRVGAGAHVGAGAAVRQCLTIGEMAVIGVGAAVVRDVEAHAVVVGVPAEVLKK